MRCAAVLLLLASTATAAAAPSAPTGLETQTDPSFSFTWSAPAGCPVREEVLERAERLVGHALTRSAAAEPIGLIATVHGSDEDWRLSVDSGSNGEVTRTVRANSCEELADAMALLIALSVDPTGAFSAAMTQVPPAPGSASSAPGPVPAERAPARLDAQPSVPDSPPLNDRIADGVRVASAAPVHLALGALVAVGSGRLPGAAPGGVLLGELSLESWMVGIDVGFFPNAHESRAELGADLSLATLSASFGHSWFDDLLTPYAAVELDRLHGLGTGIKANNSGTIWFLASDLGLRLGYPVQRSIRVLVQAQATLLLQQGRFYIDPNTDVFRPTRLSLQVGLGAELRIR